MKKYFLSLVGAAVLAGSMSVAVPEPAQARHWHGHRPHQVCRIVVKKKVVWRHGHKKVIRYKVKRCWLRW
ncbi:hypothetical protein LJR234_004114 [Mesorhizobium amorphae]|uniref:hypothetical protein n=1 Tax=Mesorhizobium TaxID=68287 RepID=UPI000B6A4E8D|nr:hypothetical protein [Mesorhizobium amorphae]OWK18488.1 hypothetical protein AJ88_05850 [Mesorhizobium amorphae CCBAU 01583]